MSLKTAAEITAMLKTVIVSGTGTAASIGKPAAGKTGTTDEYKDAYFVGYTPDVVTGSGLEMTITKNQRTIRWNSSC